MAYRLMTCLPHGQGGIRTHDTLVAYTRSPGVPLQPLEHLSRRTAPKLAGAQEAGQIGYEPLGVWWSSSMLVSRVPASASRRNGSTRCSWMTRETARYAVGSITVPRSFASRASASVSVACSL